MPHASICIWRLFHTSVTPQFYPELLQEELALLQQGQGMLKPAELGYNASGFLGHLEHPKCKTQPGCLSLAYKGGFACWMVTPLANWQEGSSKASLSHVLEVANLVLVCVCA